jgi:hypothetical protein
MQSKTRVNVRVLAALSLAAIFVSSSYGQTAKSDEFASQKKLDQHQINRLVASAKTPEDHQRIAEYYQEQAVRYESQARAYAAKIAAYERSPYFGSCAMCVTTSYSLQAAVRSLRTSKQCAEERADQMQKLAAMHEQLSSIARASDSSSGL